MRVPYPPQIYTSGDLYLPRESMYLENASHLYVRAEKSMILGCSSIILATEWMIIMVPAWLRASDPEKVLHSDLPTLNLKRLDAFWLWEIEGMLFPSQTYSYSQQKKGN